jgi:hypothetical protein
LRDINEEIQMRPPRRSLAAQDEQRLLVRDRPIPDPAKPIIAFTARTYLRAASEHIGGLAALYAYEEILLAPMVLARSAIEHCAHAIWIQEVAGLSVASSISKRPRGCNITAPGRLPVL